ncbi:alpha/beta hydrolase [Brachybacterium tyrofermentans]|uniref:alpha/beta hydrolase n=1 Tax=Brachybacterium tyrofermentans TaxID=47848 RepID=UPI003FD29DBA
MTILRQARRWALLLLAALLALVVVAGALLLAWSRFGLMEAEQGPLGQVVEDSGVSVTESSTSLILQPAGAGSSATGLVFYPGAKVEADAYAARLADLVTEQKMTVVIVKPWLHLALFDRRGLDTFTADLPEVGSWIVGGHSLGGVRACQVARDADALLLLGSYCANGLSERVLPVLSLAGSEDGLSTPEKIADARDLLPGTATLVEIEGASHASFGDYGPQDGDGTASISDEEMDAEVSAEVEAFVDSFG